MCNKSLYSIHKGKKLSCSRPRFMWLNFFFFLNEGEFSLFSLPPHQDFVFYIKTLINYHVLTASKILIK